MIINPRGKGSLNKLKGARGGYYYINVRFNRGGHRAQYPELSYSETNGFRVIVTSEEGNKTNERIG